MRVFNVRFLAREMDYNCQAEEELFQRWRSAEKGWMCISWLGGMCRGTNGSHIKEQDVY